MGRSGIFRVLKHGETLCETNISTKVLVSLQEFVHILVCMGRDRAKATDKGAIVMTEKRGTVWSTEPQPQDVDDLIFWGQTGPRVSQR